MQMHLWRSIGAQHARHGRLPSLALSWEAPVDEKVSTGFERPAEQHRRHALAPTSAHTKGPEQLPVLDPEPVVSRNVPEFCGQSMEAEIEALKAKLARAEADNAALQADVEMLCLQTTSSATFNTSSVLQERILHTGKLGTCQSRRSRLGGGGGFMAWAAWGHGRPVDWPGTPHEGQGPLPGAAGRCEAWHAGDGKVPLSRHWKAACSEPMVCSSGFMGLGLATAPIPPPPPRDARMRPAVGGAPLTAALSDVAVQIGS